MGADYRTYRIKEILWVLEILFESAIHSIFECCRTASYRYHGATQNFHFGDIRVLFFDIDLAHVNLTLKAYQCAGGCQRYTVLSCSGFSQNFGFTHMLG